MRAFHAQKTLEGPLQVLRDQGLAHDRHSSSRGYNVGTSNIRRDLEVTKLIYDHLGWSNTSSMWTMLNYVLVPTCARSAFIDVPRFMLPLRIALLHLVCPNLIRRCVVHQGFAVTSFPEEASPRSSRVNT